MLEIIPLNLIHKYKNFQIKKYRRHIVASGILTVDSKALLLKRGPNNHPAPGTWALPAGGVELLETSEEAVVRELKEEINVDVKINKLIRTENYFYDENQVRTHLIEFIYYVLPLRKDFRIKLDQCHTEYRFVPIKELGKYTSLAEPRRHAIIEIHKNL